MDRHKSQTSPTLIRKFLFLFLLAGLEGRSALQGRRALARSGRPAVDLFLFDYSFHKFTGIVSC